MQLYRYTSGNPPTYTAYFLSPHNLGDYPDPLLAVSVQPSGNPLALNTSYIEPMGSHNEVAEAFAALDWQPVKHIPPEVVAHRQLPDDHDLATIRWSGAQAPDDFITCLEDMVIARENEADNKLARISRGPNIVLLILGGLGGLALVYLVSTTF